MRITSLLLVLACMAAAPSIAEVKFDVLLKFSPEYGEALAGKSVALVRSKPPLAERANVGKIISGAGRRADDTGSHGDFDPAEIFAARFPPLFAQQYGMVLAPAEPFQARSSWGAIAAVPSDADYLLYIQTTHLRINFEKDFKLNPPYWSGVGLQMALLDRKNGERVLMGKCYSHTRGRTDLPDYEALRGRGGKLWDDIAASLAWNCMRRFADSFLPDPSAMPPPPPGLVDPTADYARAHPEK